jgi:hypothetical protein
VTLLAGTDFDISGNFTSRAAGLFYARDQFNLSGNGLLLGQVMALNEDDTSGPGGKNLVPLQSGYIVISGNPTITYNGGGVGGGAATFVNWRECRGPNPADPCG